MFENYFLDDLEDDLFLQLDELVRRTQLQCLPFSRSGTADRKLHENHPQLADQIKEELLRRVEELSFLTSARGYDNRLLYSPKLHIKCVDDVSYSSNSQEILGKRSKEMKNPQSIPSIRKPTSTADLMFDMDDKIDNDEFHTRITKPLTPLLKTNVIPVEPKISVLDGLKYDWNETDKSIRNDGLSQSQSHSRKVSCETLIAGPMPSAKTWSPLVVSTSKLGMREIMEQTHLSCDSILKMDISAQKSKENSLLKPKNPKLSQKERKKLLQQQALNKSRVVLDEDFKISSPWKVIAQGEKTTVQENITKSSSQAENLAKFHSSSVPSNYSRHTVSSDTGSEFHSQSKPRNLVAIPPEAPLTASQTNSKSTVTVPFSESYAEPADKPKPLLMLPMADIILQQKRELEVIKEAVAKRSLREIQEDQAFQEWWDQESKRVSEEEAIKFTASNLERLTQNKAGRGKNQRRRGKPSGSKESLG